MNRDDQIFAEAIDLPAGAVRTDFLDRACAGDPAARARIEALLAGHEAAAGFLESPPPGQPAPRPEEKIGDVIGRYTLLRKLGEGGCGVVYLAEQREPLRRNVALKVIKLGMDTREVIARFEAERQALALMDHPDIARVFDAGATDAGRPFFVMEYVDGVPITRFCDEHRLPMAARLELFARVCTALQHAHQKGIIHRDLKPSNILVTQQDGGPAPKVIDFGIAKATHGRLTEHTLLTGIEQFVGTPAYMSPEQAERRDLDIDTRSDVYSLGVLLYELLTGRPPYDPKELVRAGLEEIRRIIREVDPPRPSTRIATLADADRATVASLRGSGSVHLAAVLRGDLDWIVMRCLEKDRDRRYGTAHELADDVRRHLRQEPVAARPPSRLYRLQKFVARNRLACASVAAVAAALVLGTVVSVRQAVRATRAEGLARLERDAAQAAGRAEAVARADAQRRQEQAEALLTFMLGDFRTELKKLGRLNLLDSVGEQAMAYFAALDPRDLTDTALARQAKALTQIGETRMDQARYPEAAAAFTTAYGRAAALAERHPRDGDMLFERAQAEYWMGFVARRRGDYVLARTWLTRYRDSTLELVALEGPTLRARQELTYGHHNLAVLELDRGALPAAEASFTAERAALGELIAAHPADSALQLRRADVASWLGTVAERDGRYAEAIGHFTQMAKEVDALAAREPTVVRWQFKQAESLTFIGSLRALLGQTAEAAAHYDRARPLFDTLTTHDPKNQQWQVGLMNLRLQQAALRLHEGDAAGANALLGETRDRLERLAAAEPSSRAFARLLAATWRLEGSLRLAQQRPDANEAVAQAARLADELVQNPGADNWAYWEFGQAHLLLGRLALARNRPDEARDEWNRVASELAPRAAGSNDWRLLDPAAQAGVLSGRTAAARPLIDRLRAAGYQPLDPLASSTLDLAVTSVTSNHQ
jgi:serine/threonine-protein kinase